MRWVAGAEPITDVDTTAAEMIEELDASSVRMGAELAFAEMKDPVKDRIEQYGLNARLGPQRFFATLGAATHAYVRETGVEWVDWTDVEREEQGHSATNDAEQGPTQPRGEPLS